MLLRYADAPTAGLLLGATLAAMFLGHWYLNTPTMELKPLAWLLNLALVAVAWAVVCGIGLAMQLSAGTLPVLAFVALRGGGADRVGNFDRHGPEDVENSEHAERNGNSYVAVLALSSAS